MRKRLLALLGAMLLGILPALVLATPAAATPNWATCPSYDRVCLFFELNGGGSRLDIFNSTGVCLNANSFNNDQFSSVDNGWNDSDLRVYLYLHVNCSGASMFVGGNDAVNLNCCGREWINNNASSWKVRCVDFFNQCYRGP